MVSLTLLPKTLVLMLAICVVFSIALTENLQLADGFSVGAKPMIFDLQKGETGTFKWTVTNMDDEDIFVELYATGPGSELMIFDQYLTIPPHLSVYPEIFVVVPDDHKNNIEYHPELFALQRAGPPPTEGEPLSASISISVQMKSLPIIKIGDNPIYTPPVVKEQAEIPPPPKVKEAQPVKEETKELTAAEKIARIQEANKARTVDDAFEESFEEEAVPELAVDDNYMEEPVADKPTITDSATVEKVECGFIDWILSLFGMAKC